MQGKRLLRIMERETDYRLDPLAICVGSCLSALDDDGVHPVFVHIAVAAREFGSADVILSDFAISKFTFVLCIPQSHTEGIAKVGHVEPQPAIGYDGVQEAELGLVEFLHPRLLDCI